MASRKIHQKFANKSCRLLTGNISPPTGCCVTGSPLGVGFRSNVRSSCPWDFMSKRSKNLVLYLRLPGSFVGESRTALHRMTIDHATVHVSSAKTRDYS